MAASSESSGAPRAGASRRGPRDGKSARPRSEAPRTAREAAARRLTDQARRFPDLILAPLDTSGLDDRDAGLANAIYDAAARRWLTLSHLLNQVLKQPMHLIEPGLQGVLLSGAAQLLLLDRIPAHAAIDESVELAKRLVRPGAGGLTNAVLRKVAAMRAGDPIAADGSPLIPRDHLPLSDGRWLPLSGPLLPEREHDRIAAATSHPKELIEKWAAKLPSRAVQDLALHSLVPAPTILNTAYATAPLPPGLIPHSIPGHHVFTGGRAELLTLLDSRTDLWVQDPSSSRAIAAVASDLTPSLIIDACAGQGTKTRQLAAAFPNAKIIATDVDPARFRTLTDTFRGHSRVEAIRPADLLLSCAGKADLVLLDVPCSNTGVLARRIEAKYRCDKEQLDRLAAIQRQIIADTIPLLATSPRGRILYSTCSIDEEENGRQAAWAMKWHRFRTLHSESMLPAGLPGGDPAAYHDGSYSVLLG